MVHQNIKVYARLRKEVREKFVVAYEITKKKKEYEDLMFYPGTSCFLNSCCGFRFYKVFNVNSTQADVFDLVAKPVISSVIEGFNGTIFAYGQTGSGKTYSITGSPKNYNERGIIPRSIQYIFKHYESVSEKPTIYISYMEIYNEVGYDLLSTKQSKISRILDELPRVTLFEDKKGEAHIRNLNVFPVTTEQEAMRLLFLGDTNRTIAETVSNEFSSRSHCIFTLYINLRDGNSANLRSSKLHLVDLAGSERVSKTHSKGPCLQEAKSINLSLHFLQQVILALSESNRTHIPYRNSMLTHILKDSLNGNCITSMLATLSTLQSNIEESISTCRFAQKVSTIATDPIINVLDPQKEIHFLKLKIEDLEKRLSLATGFSNSKSLSKQKMEEYVLEVQSFVGSDRKLMTVGPNMTEIQFCFNLLKNEVENKKKECVQLENSLITKTEGLSILNDELLKKDKEIVQLKSIIDRIPESPVPLSSCDKRSTPVTSARSLGGKMRHEEKLLYETFMSRSEISEDLIFYKKALEKQFGQAKLCAETIEKCQKKINLVKQQLDTPLSWTERNRLIPELEQQQALYKKTLLEIENIQKETVHLQCGLERAKVESEHKFKMWMQERQIGPDKISDHKFVDYNCFGKKQYLGNFSVDKLDDFLNIQCVYDPNNVTNNVPSLDCLKDEVYNYKYYFDEKPNPISTADERECSDNQCHRCKKLNSDSILPKSLLEDSIAIKNEDISEDSVAAEGSVSSIISLKSESNEDLLAIKKSLFSINGEDEMVKNYEYETEVPEKDVETVNGIEKYFIGTDGLEFREFMKSVAVTGIDDIDNEIFSFYRSKFC